jgi:hypothetical protein
MAGRGLIISNNYFCRIQQNLSSLLVGRHVFSAAGGVLGYVCTLLPRICEGVVQYALCRQFCLCAGIIIGDKECLTLSYMKFI